MNSVKIADGHDRVSRFLTLTDVIPNNLHERALPSQGRRSRAASLAK
jgi:hypothetical protein